MKTILKLIVFTIGMIVCTALQAQTPNAFQAIDLYNTGLGIGIADSNTMPAGVNFAGVSDLESPLCVGVIKLGEFKGAHVGAMTSAEFAYGYSYLSNDTASLLNQAKIIIESPYPNLSFVIHRLPVYYSNEQAWQYEQEGDILYRKPDGTIALTYDPEYPLCPASQE